MCASIVRLFGFILIALILVHLALQAAQAQSADEVQALNGQAVQLYNQGKYAEAFAVARQALALAERTLGPEHPDTLGSVNNLAFLHFAQHDWSDAAQLWRRSSTAIASRAQRGAQGAGLAGKKSNEAQQLDWQFWGLVKAAYRLAPEGRMPDIASASEMFQTAQWMLGSEAAQSLAQMAARGTKGDAALAPLVRERQDLVEEWQRRQQIQAVALGQATAERNTKAEAENRERMTAIDTRIAEIDKRLAKEFPDYAVLASPSPLAVADVQAQLDADEALVLFLDTPEAKSTPEETFIWMVTNTEARWMRSDLGTASLKREVRALRCGLDEEEWKTPTQQNVCVEQLGLPKELPDLSKPLPFDLDKAHALYKAPFGQVEDLIKGKQLLIVPSGALTQLPPRQPARPDPDAAE